MAACANAVGADDPPAIYIVTDLEGASGVYRFAQTREPGNPLGAQAMEYLMGDIAPWSAGLRDRGSRADHGPRRPRLAGILCHT